MKVLWVVNMLVGDLAAKKGIKLTSGQWLNAEIENERNQLGIELIICTSSAESEELVVGNIKYLTLPHGNVTYYDVNSKHIEDWRALYNREKPDLLLIWGTEYEIGLCALLANNKTIPSLIYIQGVMKSIAENYCGGFSNFQLSRMSTIVERIRKTTLLDIETEKQNRAKSEQESIRLCDGIVVENEWASNLYLEENPTLKVYKNRLPIRDTFRNYSWNSQSFTPFLITTTNAAYPLKGLHFLLDAIDIVKKKYPMVILEIPGTNIVERNGIIGRAKQSGYGKYIKRKIFKLRLTDNIRFLGPLSPEMYAQRMAQSNVFISASCVENHCSALREAMMVGVPCISSKVGGIVDFAENGKNCLLYDPFDNTTLLAEKICALFDNNSLCCKISEAGREKIQKMYSEDNLPTVIEVYQQLLSSFQK